jgi:hypothetical protein
MFTVVPFFCSDLLLWEGTRLPAFALHHAQSLQGPGERLQVEDALHLLSFLLVLFLLNFLPVLFMLTCMLSLLLVLFLLNFLPVLFMLTSPF